MTCRVHEMKYRLKRIPRNFKDLSVCKGKGKGEMEREKKVLKDE